MIYIVPGGPQIVSIWEDTIKSGASKNFALRAIGTPLLTSLVAACSVYQTNSQTCVNLLNKILKVGGPHDI